MAQVLGELPTSRSRFDYVPRSIIRDCCEVGLLLPIEDEDPSAGFLGFLDETVERESRNTKLRANESVTVGISNNQMSTQRCDHVTYLRVPHANYCGSCGIGLQPIRELYKRNESVLVHVVNYLLGR